MTVATGKILRCATRFSQVSGEDVVNVWYLRTNFATPQDEDDVLSAVQVYLGSVFADFDHLMDNSAQPVDVRVDVVNWSGTKWMTVQNIGTDLFGLSLTLAGTSDALPSGSAVLGKLLTPSLKRAGAKFFGLFTTASNSTNGGVGATTISAVATGLAKLLTPHVISAGNQLEAVIISSVDGFVSDLIGVTVDYIWAYQRRRKLNVGS